MRLKTLAQITKIKPIFLGKNRIRRRPVLVGRQDIVSLCGGPFDGRKIPLQSMTYGTLAFRMGNYFGRYNQQNTWEDL